MNAHQPATEWTDEDGAEARRRAEFGVAHDRERARKQRDKQRTGAEVARGERLRLTAALQAKGKLL